MAIQPPGFNVPSISPASLLGNRNQGGGFEASLNQAINFAFQRQLLQESRELSAEAAAIQATARLEENFQENLTRGVVRTEGLPGMELEAVSGPEGTSFAGETFFRQRDVDQALAQAELDRPIPGGSGETTFGDVSLGGDVVPSLLADAQQGNMAAITSIVNSIRDIPGIDPGTVTAARSFAAAIASDGVTRAEQADFERQFAPSVRNTMRETSRVIANMNREEQAATNRARIELSSRSQLLGEDGILRDIPTADAQLLAVFSQGGEMSDEGRARVEEIQNQLRPRREAIDIFNKVDALFTNSGNPSSPDNGDFITWIMTQIKDRDNQVTNQVLADIVTDNTGQNVSLAHVQDWSNSAQAAPFRAMYALKFAAGRDTRSQYQELQRTGVQLPFPVAFATEASEIIDPEGFNDVPAIPIDAAPERIETPPGVEGDEEALSTAIGSFGSGRELALVRQGNLESESPELAGRVDEIIANSTAEEAVTRLNALARDIVQGSSNSPLGRVTQQSNSLQRKVSEDLLETARMIAKNPQSYQIWKDSIYSPTRRSRVQP